MAVVVMVVRPVVHRRAAVSVVMRVMPVVAGIESQKAQYNCAVKHELVHIDSFWLICYKVKN